MYSVKKTSEGLADAPIEEDASMEAPPAGSVTLSPQPTTEGVVIGDPHEAIPTNTPPDAGNSPVVSSSNYYDQAGIPLPPSSSERYNIDATSERKKAWDTQCRKDMWKVGRKAGDPSSYNFPRGTEVRLLISVHRSCTHHPHIVAFTRRRSQEMG